MKGALLPAAGLVVLVLVGIAAAADTGAGDSPCVECLKVRVGPPVIVRGPFPDELDAPFSALRLPDGSFRGFSANGSTYAIESASLLEMDGPRKEVLQAGEAGSVNDCGRWLTSLVRTGDEVLGLVHQEHACDYNQGRTDKSMAIAVSADNGLSWTDLGTIITGTEPPQPNQINGEGDCTMVEGLDGYLYAYCLRNTDWQTIVARAPVAEPTNWRKYNEGGWSEPGLGGQATAIGFIGTGVGYLRQHDWVAAVTTDRWFGGVRLSLSTDRVTFVDLADPLLAIDGAEWDRPAETALLAYGTVLDPATGSNAVGDNFLLSYIYVPPGQGFESRYLVSHEVSLSVEDTPQPVQVGVALTRWVDRNSQGFVTSTGPLTDDRLGYERDAIVAYLMTRAPDGVGSIRVEECTGGPSGSLDQMVAADGGCAADGYARERTSGWLYAEEQPGAVPVYRCLAEGGLHFASSAADCEGLGRRELLLGYGLAP